MVLAILGAVNWDLKKRRHSGLVSSNRWDVNKRNCRPTIHTAGDCGWRSSGRAFQKFGTHSWANLQMKRRHLYLKAISLGPIQKAEQRPNILKNAIKDLNNLGKEVGSAISTREV